MAEEETAKKKMNGGVIAAIVIGVVAAIAAVVAVIVINVTKPNIVGKYSITAILDSDGNESSESMEMFKALGANYEVEFKEDKTGTLKVTMDSEKMSSLVNSFASALTGTVTDENGDVTTIDTSSSDASSSLTNLSNTEMPFTYDDKKIKMTVTGMGNTEMDYEFKDGAVIISYYGQKMKFTK